MKKKTTTTTETIKAEGERFTHLTKDAGEYPLLSIHEFEGVKYQVAAILTHADGVAVEFVRVP